MSSTPPPSTDLNCQLCDGTGNHTVRDGDGTWRYPVPCGACHGTGLDERRVDEAVSFLLDKGRATSTHGYNILLSALRRINHVKRWR